MAIPPGLRRVFELLFVAALTLVLSSFFRQSDVVGRAALAGGGGGVAQQHRRRASPAGGAAGKANAEPKLPPPPTSSPLPPLLPSPPAAAAGAELPRAAANLPRRPPRRPPQWLVEGRCSAASPLSQEVPLSHEASFFAGGGGGEGGEGGGGFRSGWSATAGAHEEHTGDVLLGECDCPLKNPPPGWAGFDCGAFDWRILADLAPWHGVNVTHAMLDSAYEMNTANIPPGFHFSHSRGAWSYRKREPSSVYENALHEMLATVAEMLELPDVEFVLQAWDHQKVPRQDPVPVFSLSRDAGKNDVAVPHPYLWKGADLDVSLDPDCPPTLEGRAGTHVVWRGTCMGPTLGMDDAFVATYIRTRATSLSHDHPGVLAAGVISMCTPSQDPRGVFPTLDLETGVCHQRYLLFLDGNTISGRSSRWMHAGAVLLKPDSIFSEWYYHLLRPWVHYVPVREFLEDLPEQAHWIVNEASPATKQCLADNLKAFAKKYINKETIACYWWRLLTAWKRQQPQPSRRL